MNDVFRKLYSILMEFQYKYGCTICARWAFQKVRNGASRSFELRIYLYSTVKFSRDLSLELAQKLKDLGYGAHVRSKDTFITVRRGKEEIAVVLHKLGYLKDLVPSDLPKITRRRILEILNTLDKNDIVVEIEEKEVENYISNLLEEINNEYRRVSNIELIKEKYEKYIKIRETSEELRQRIRQNIDYVTWLTLCDGITSVIVDHNVDTLQYGTTRPEIPSIIIKTLGLAKITVTREDDKSRRLHIIATVNNYIAKNILGRELPEIDQIIHKIRKILNTTKTILVENLRSKFNIHISDNVKMSEVNNVLKKLYIDRRLRIDMLIGLARFYSHTIAEYVDDPFKALAGIFDGDGVFEKRKEGDYGIAVSFAPYTVKGFSILMFLTYAESRGHILINGFNESNLSLRIWLSPSTRSSILQYMKHPYRSERIAILSRRSTLAMIQNSCVELQKVEKALQDVLKYINSQSVEISAEWKVERHKNKRSLVLLLKFAKKKSDIRLIDIAKEVVNILRRYDIGAYQCHKSAIIRIKRGKIELAYLLHKLGIMSELIPREADGQLLKVIIAKIEELDNKSKPQWYIDSERSLYNTI